MVCKNICIDYKAKKPVGGMKIFGRSETLPKL